MRKIKSVQSTGMTRYGEVILTTFEPLEFPLYVRLGQNGSALRRIGSADTATKPIYYRDAGHWDVGALFVGTERTLIAWEPDKNSLTHHLQGTELVEITEAEWRLDNGAWAPIGDKEVQELKYLRWFYQHCDFGPAHEDVVCSLNECYEEATGLTIPEGYRNDE